MIDGQILVLEHVEDDLHGAAGFPLPRFHRRHGDLRRLLLGEAEDAGGDAAKGDARYPVFPGDLQAGFVAGRELLSVPLRQDALHDGTHGVDDPAAGQVVGRGDLGPAGGLAVALAGHEGGAVAAELHAGIGVDAVVDAVVAGAVAAGHAGVGGVNDGVAAQRGDVPLPEVQIAPDGGQVAKIGDALLGDGGAEIVVLDGQKIGADGGGLPDVHQRAQEALLLLRVTRDGDFPVAGLLLQQRLNQKQAAFTLVHVSSLLWRLWMSAATSATVMDCRDASMACSAAARRPSSAAWMLRPTGHWGLGLSWKRKRLSSAAPTAAYTS